MQNEEQIKSEMSNNIPNSLNNISKLSFKKLKKKKRHLSPPKSMGVLLIHSIVTTLDILDNTTSLFCNHFCAFSH